MDERKNRLETMSIDEFIMEFEQIQNSIREMAKEEMSELEYKDFPISRKEFFENNIYNIKSALKYSFANPIKLFLENTYRHIQACGKPFLTIKEITGLLRDLAHGTRRICFFIMCLIILPVSTNKMRSRLSFVMHEWVLEELMK